MLNVTLAPSSRPFLSPATRGVPSSILWLHSFTDVMPSIWFSVGQQMVGLYTLTVHNILKTIWLEMSKFSVNYSIRHYSQTNVLIASFRLYRVGLFAQQFLEAAEPLVGWWLVHILRQVFQNQIFSSRSVSCYWSSKSRPERVEQVVLQMLWRSHSPLMPHEVSQQRRRRLHSKDLLKYEPLIHKL